MTDWIALPRVEGLAARQAHADLPEGTYEREIGKHGFYGPSTQMYHRNPPTSWVSWEGPHRPRAFDLTQLHDIKQLPWDSEEVVSNPRFRLRFWRTEGKMEDLVRNADGDDLLFVHQGKGSLFCDWGHLPFGEGDYILLPRGTMWRIECHAPVTMLIIEATDSSFKLPERGLVGAHAIFDPGILETPHLDDQFKEQQQDGEARRTWRIRVKRHNVISTVTFGYNPLDAVGWQGTLLPVRLNWRDMRPLMSHRLHLPPSAHTTFVADRFVVCTFVPRPFEKDPGALKVPFFHNNDDYDELIFYHHGKFVSRDSIHPGMVTLHPGGCTHGPHTQALKRAFQPGATDMDDVAVMIDARDAMVPGPAMSKIEDQTYVDAWKGRQA